MVPFSMLHSQGDGICSWCLAVCPHHTCILTLNASKSKVLLLSRCCPRSRLVLWLGLLCVVQLHCASAPTPVSAVACVCIASALWLWEHRGIEEGCLSVYLSVGVSVWRSPEEWVGVMGLWNRVKETDCSDWTSSVPRRRRVLELSCIYNNE